MPLEGGIGPFHFQPVCFVDPSRADPITSMFQGASRAGTQGRAAARDCPQLLGRRRRHMEPQPQSTPRYWVLTKVWQGCREILTGAALFLVPACAWLTWQSLVTPGKPWLWVAYSGWATGFLGIWIAWARAGEPARKFAADALPAVSAAGVTLLGVFANDGELAGPLLSGLAVVGVGVWLLRRAANRARDTESQRRHDELMQQYAKVLGLLDTIEASTRPAVSAARPTSLLTWLLRR